MGAELYMQLSLALQMHRLHDEFAGSADRVLDVICDSMRILRGATWSNEGFRHALDAWVDAAGVENWSQHEADHWLAGALAACQQHDQLVAVVNNTLPDGTRLFLYISPCLWDGCSQNLGAWTRSNGLGDLALPERRMS